MSLEVLAPAAGLGHPRQSPHGVQAPFGQRRPLKQPAPGCAKLAQPSPSAPGLFFFSLSLVALSVLIARFLTPLLLPFPLFFFLFSSQGFEGFLLCSQCEKFILTNSPRLGAEGAVVGFPHARGLPWQPALLS